MFMHRPDSTPTEPACSELLLCVDRIGKVLGECASKASPRESGYPGQNRIANVRRTGHVLHPLCSVQRLHLRCRLLCLIHNSAMGAVKLPRIGVCKTQLQAHLLVPTETTPCDTTEQ